MESKNNVDEKTQQFVTDQLDEVKQQILLDVRRLKTEIPQITASTPVPVKLTVRGWWGLFLTFVTFATFVGLAYARDQADKNEIRRQMLELDAKWQVRLLETSGKIEKTISDSVSGLKDDSSEELQALKAAISRIPSSFPPADWMQNVYHRDRSEIILRLKELEQQVQELKQK